ncbi:excinuclease ABC subunit UvrA [bacterium SCSIO 12643]|nr:excinuclease ABC subunit UvrA [bacterium SCSIO 12643]
MAKKKISNLRNSHISIKGARMHNLKNIDVRIPRNKFVVVTGLSGSGKSSLAFDTLYAEGQRRYVESLSSYARQFLGKIDKPEVDDIEGISPAIAIQQKVNTRNPRSTVGTTTEIYDYLKLLFARIGRTYSPISGNEVKRHNVSDVVDYILNLPTKTRLMITAPLIVKNRKIEEQLTVLKQQGFDRLVDQYQIHDITEWLKSPHDQTDQLSILVDRISVNPDDEDLRNRLADSVQTSFYEGHGSCDLMIKNGDDWDTVNFNHAFELDGMTFETPSVNFFSFNNPVGACKTCEGFGSVIGIDPDLVIPNKSLSVYDEAIVCWRGEKMSAWKNQLVMASPKFNFPIHRPIGELTKKEYDLLWNGNKYFDGIHAFFKEVEAQSYKIQYRVMLSRYRGKTTCPDCKGTRLRKDASYVKVLDKNIQELMLTPVKHLLPWTQNLASQLSEHDRVISKRILTEINNRLSYLSDVGLDYLDLNRLSNTLSGGESQRINLSTMLGSSLVGSMYILDEPSIGLHPRDTQRLIKVLKSLRDVGNTVIVVEHDEEIMQESDEIIDLGPEAGTHGGQLVFQGTLDDMNEKTESLTAQYLKGHMNIPMPTSRRKWKYHIDITSIHQNNLKNIDIQIPLEVMTVITGVSGSGKSSLVRDVFYPSLNKLLSGHEYVSGNFGSFGGDIQKIESVEFVDQNPIGKSSRSNPVTYVKAFDDIRALFSSQKLAKVRGYKPSYFSFNVEGGRCENCKGDGNIVVEMQFMADVHLVCSECNGHRYTGEVLEVKYKDHNISDILRMTIDDAMTFFEQDKTGPAKKIVSKIKPLQEVGLGYVQLGQSSNTLSGGEAQRIKLASFLTKGKNAKKTLFIFDEPTTGLHFHDIHKLLKAFNALLDNGHSLVIVEHNTDIIKSADWIIDLGPEGGEEGGQLVFSGVPEDLIHCTESYTAKFITDKF